MKEAIKVEHLSVNYDKTPVLWDVSFSIPVGVMVGVIGPNGAGKSTLLKSLLKMVKPLSGWIDFFGKAVAYVPQRSEVDWDFPITVFDVALMGRYGKLGLLRRPSAADRQAARAALEQVGLLAFADRQINQLSGGQQQRLFIARALVQEADLYLMDEPFAAVDAATEKVLVELFNKMKRSGKTLVVVHHELASVKSYFDWLLMLNTCLIGCGPVPDVFNEKNLARTYGTSSSLLGEAARLVQNKASGIE